MMAPVACSSFGWCTICLPTTHLQVLFVNCYQIVFNNVDFHAPMHPIWSPPPACTAQCLWATNPPSPLISIDFSWGFQYTTPLPSRFLLTFHSSMAEEPLKTQVSPYPSGAQPLFSFLSPYTGNLFTHSWGAIKHPHSIAFG